MFAHCTVGGSGHAPWEQAGLAIEAWAASCISTSHTLLLPAPVLSVLQLVATLAVLPSGSCMAQAAHRIADLGDICIHVSSFLQISQIACSEEAGIFRCKDVARLSWHKAALALLAHVPIWGPSGEGVIAQLLDAGVQGKEFLQELQLLRRAIFPPKSWSPAIRETAFNSLKARACYCCEMNTAPFCICCRKPLSMISIETHCSCAVPYLFGVLAGRSAGFATHATT